MTKNKCDLTTTLLSAFEKMISDGTICPGGKLPPERDLAKHFSVNRGSVRQALKAMQFIGLVRQRVGDGTYLTKDASSALSVPLDFFMLVEGIAVAEAL